MARPRNICFFEVPLETLPEDQPWLIEYHEKSRTLVKYLTDNGAGSTAYHGAIRCLTLLREYLLRKGNPYTGANAIQWYMETGPYPAGYLVTLTRFEDLFFYGEIQPINAFPRAIPYSQNLTEPWKSILNEFLETLSNYTESSMTQIKNIVSRFLNWVQRRGICVPSDISFSVLEEYCRIDAHQSDQSKARYTYAIGDLLLFMADKGLCIHGLSWYPYYWMHDRIFRLCDMTKHQNLAIEELRQESLAFPAEEFAVLIPGFLEQFNAFGYSKAPCKVARYVLTNLLLFLEMHDLGYHQRIADIWLDHEKAFHSGDGWKQARRILFLFGLYVQEGDVIPQSFNRIRPLLCESLPSWCLEELDKYIVLKKKEGWERSTLDMIRASITRFCSFLVETGVTGFSGLTANALKEFNLWDKHHTIEGKNAYNVRIRKFIRFLERKGIVPYGTHQALCCSAAPKEKVVITLTQKEKGAIKKKHTNCLSSMELRDRAMVLLGTKMGLRASDIVSISLEDIDWDRQTLRVIQEKTDHEIMLPIPTEVGNAIYLYLTTGRANEKTSCRYLFIKERVPYDGLHRGACASALRRTLPERSVPGSGFHVTRKTFATDCLCNGTGKQGIVNLLGQRDTQSLNHYLLLDETRMRMCPLSLAETGLLMEGGRYGSV